MAESKNGTRGLSAGERRRRDERRARNEAEANKTPAQRYSEQLRTIANEFSREMKGHDEKIQAAHQARNDYQAAAGKRIRELREKLNEAMATSKDEIPPPAAKPIEPEDEPDGMTEKELHEWLKHEGEDVVGLPPPATEEHHGG